MNIYFRCVFTMMSKSLFWRSFLEASKQVTNVTFVTGDGGHTATHALLLAAASDLLRSLLQELPDTEEHAVIILPDFSDSDLQLCLDIVMGGSTQGVDRLILETLGITGFKQSKQQSLRFYCDQCDYAGMTPGQLNLQKGAKDNSP